MNKRQNYHEGFLDKRSFKDKTSRKMWTCLCGNVLYFYNDKRETECTWKLDLGTLVSITDDNTVDQKLDVAKLNIQTKDGIYKFAAPNAEARELWKGLIKSVAELSVPTKLNLLPGQMVMLEEVVKKEKERLRNAQQDMPSCFHPVSRMEAELLLEREANRGNLLLRPSSDGNGFALSTREEMKEAIYKHYHVSRTPENGFSIDVDNPVACNSLHEVVKYLLEATAGALTTLDREETYQKNIFCISTDAENGERRVHSANTSVHIPLQGLHPKQEVTAIGVQQRQLLGLLEEVKQLHIQNVEKDRRITQLERRVDELEQSARKNDVVITGTKIRPHTYAPAVATDDGEPSQQEENSVEQQVASYLRSKGITWDLEHIEACHSLPMRNDRPPAIIMRLSVKKTRQCC
ncbi:signal-transducing adaptor protein 2-like isoform X2 [Corythoichthys intestinalis]|uniref:signal-transducing adaptor protein 2-like isoform X2 n=1 Tax=Corythoichthys intestinalis TaxID=161448 RepID=UPI0025A62EF5|nr:signal-transducing adaptor protein 2-like isoform X2 [Corythoichthys intestinalis]